jgi:hypothetical protein
MGRRAFLAGVLLSLPFTLSVALLCTTSRADSFYGPLSVVTMGAVFGVMFGSQVARGVRAFHGAPLARPLASWSAAYMAGVFAVMLCGDLVIRILEPGFLPVGAIRTIALWAAVLGPMASLAVLSAVTVAVGVGAARARLRQPASGARRRA